MALAGTYNMTIDQGGDGYRVLYGNIGTC